MSQVIDRHCHIAAKGAGVSSSRIQSTKEAAMKDLLDDGAWGIYSVPDEILFDICLRLDIPELHALSLVRLLCNPTQSKRTANADH